MLLQNLTGVIYESLDQNQLIGVIFSDIAKAFDTVNHAILKQKV